MAGLYFLAMSKFHRLSLHDCTCITVNVQRIITVMYTTFADFLLLIREHEKSSGLYGIRAHEFCDTDAAL